MLGVPTQVREYRKPSQNSQAFAVTGISSTYYGRIQNFRLRTLGVPVRNSDSREASRNSLTYGSPKLKLRIFLHRDVCVWQLKRVHWEFQCNFANVENILEIPLTFIKQTCSNHSTCREPAPSWSSLCLRSAGQQHNSSDRSYKRKYKRNKANADENDLRKG